MNIKTELEERPEETKQQIINAYIKMQKLRGWKMKTKEEILLESEISDILLELIQDQADNDIYNKMTTSDLQGMITIKAMEIIKLGIKR